MSERTMKVGLLGCGTVGAAVARMLRENADDVTRRVGAQVEVARVAVRDVSRSRDGVDPALLTTDAAAVVSDPAIDVVCELMGGSDLAGTLILEAFANGKSVVTANKELLATRGKELFDAAEAADRDLYFEAAVGGGIPLIRPLKESLAGEHIHRLIGIVNGTTNFVLTRMSEQGSSFEEALTEAKRLGYAESDPTADVEGHDAAAKCAILASIAFSSRVVATDVYTEGISRIKPLDIADARRLGYVVKLLAIAELDGGEISARVHPAMIPESHPLATVRDAFNAVFVEGPNIGQVMFFGPGAGGAATATAVVGDLISVSRNRLAGVTGVGCTCAFDHRIRPMDDTRGQYYLNLHVEDRPGVLAEIADHFGRNAVSIERVWQEGAGDEATLVFITHLAQEGAFQKTVQELREVSAVRAVASILRVEGEE
jgi:homoserine dehydrogenase